MGLTQYHHGLPLVVAVAFVFWLISGFTLSCYIIDFAPDYVKPPDYRQSGCDTYFTAALRTLTGNTFTAPFYDIVYDPNFSFAWLFSIVFTAWHFIRRAILQREEFATPSP